MFFFNIVYRWRGEITGESHDFERIIFSAGIGAKMVLFVWKIYGNMKKSIHYVFILSVV